MNSEQKLYKSRQWLKKMYKDEDMGMRDIGELCGVSKYTIRKYLIRFGIERKVAHRPRSEVQRNYRITIWMTEYMHKKFKELLEAESKGTTELLTPILSKHMIEKGFNPYKES